MAKIYISYSSKDKQFVYEYLDILKKNGHEIFMDDTVLVAGTNMQQALMDALRNADGTIVFITNNSIESKHVNSEIGLARSYYDYNQKFLIPLVNGNITVPYVIQDLMYIQIEKSDPFEIVNKVNETIDKYSKTKSSTTRNEPPTPLSQDSFAESLFNYLKQLQRKTNVGDWLYEGPTKIAYGTPVGAWDTDGFLFNSGNYSFVLRSIVQKNDSYLVVESNNLEGQLANLKLHTPGKFSNQDGVVTLLETFDMTVGLGRRSRDEVKAAFVKAGMKDNTITSFHQEEFSWTKVTSDILRWAVLREEAKRILMATGKEQISVDPSSSNFWLLKIYGDNWNLSNLDEGDDGHFNSHFNSYEKRPDYNYFANIKEGDKGFAFDYSSKNTVVFLFDVTKSLHDDEEREEIFSFTITMILKNGVALSSFIQSINFASEIGKESVRKLFPLAKEQYEYIHNLAVSQSASNSPLTIFNTPTLSKVFADIASKDVKDELGFENDVDALASVIAYRQVTPPLAVGLFGNWGSGKSFFMNKLQKKIDNLAKEKSDVFCKSVLQINFNSWHYSDSNLWASLITKIFEDIEKKGKGKPDEVNELFKNLNSTKELLLETQTEKAKVDKEIEMFKDEKKILDGSVARQSNELSSLSAKEILTGLIRDTSFQKDFEDLKNEYSFLKLNENEYHDLEKKVRELNGFVEKITESFKLFSSLLKGKRIVYSLILMALIAALIWALYENSDFFKRYVTDYKAIIYTTGCLLTGVLSFLKPAFKIVNNAFTRLKSLNETVNNLKVKANEKFVSELETLNKKLSDAKSTSTEIQKKIDLLEVQQKKLKEDISDINSGRKIIRFIESRVTDERYINNLGIISWIRKDFEQLDFLLWQQKDAKKKMEEGFIEVPISFDLERIILYIDDLDRCNESIVVSVLEAIHLLLAFPLFVVIVGVDPRWMNNALDKKYAHLLKGKEVGGTAPLLSGLGYHATSYDYLEKIFQIPFVLKPIDQHGKIKLIKSQLESNKVKENDEKIHVASSIIPSEAVKTPSVDNSDLNNTDAKNQADNGNPLPSQPPPPNSEEKLKTLEISGEEINFMGQIAFLIGDSPRTIKRYINIYRIIRTHASFEFEIDDSNSYYFAAMLMLAVITGQSDVANIFYDLVLLADDNERFSAFLNTNLSSIATADSDLSKLLVNFKNSQNEYIKILGQLRMKKFKRNLELVSRFSFRNLV